jgi:hypothetical protein
MVDEWSDLAELNRCVLEGVEHESRPTSKALEEAIAASRRHIEAAFRDSISIDDLRRIKVKVKLTA